MDKKGKFIDLPYPRLVVKEGEWTTVTVTSEPLVAPSVIGFIPWVEVSRGYEHGREAMIINNLSLAKGIEPLWLANDKKFTDLTFKVRRVAAGRFAPYEVAPVVEGTNAAQS